MNDDKNIVINILEKNGYVGLFNDGARCACHLGNLMQCDEVRTDCELGVKAPCDCSNGCDFHIVRKPVKP